MAPSFASRVVAPEARRALRALGDYQRRALDPVDRFAEATFGLIMVLTITGALRVAEAGTQEVREMLVAALGCNVAWGLVDGVMFLITSLAERARAALLYRAVLAPDDAAARAIVVGVLPDAIAGVLQPAEADRLVARIRALPEPPPAFRITGRELRGALASCLLVFAATLPPTLPYLLFQDVGRAQWVSQVAAIACLFLAGYALGKRSGIRAGLLGVAMVFIGAALVALTMALGG